MSTSGEPPPLLRDGLAAVVLDFARLLRAAGVRVGSGQVALALRALERIELTRSEDVYWTLHALWISDPRQRPLFQQAFALFWRERRPPLAILEHLRAIPDRLEQRRATLRRVAEAWAARSTSSGEAPARSAGRERRWDAALTFSEREQLSRKDFEHMSAEELQLARRWIERLVLQLAPLPSRRLRPSRRGTIDLRATLRSSARTSCDVWSLRFRSPGQRPPALLALCDISGSMERYSRVLLHFLHALSARRAGVDVHSFVFGTQLTPVTHALRERDVDLALAQIGRTARDWTGGTRIGASLRQFNQRWLRRVPARRAIVLFISDGLDRDAGADIAPALQRLRRSCRRLIWLNPLLRDAGFEPLAAGVRAILPEVDEHRPVHDLRSLEQLCAALGPALASVSRRAGKVGREP